VTTCSTGGTGTGTGSGGSGDSGGNGGLFGFNIGAKRKKGLKRSTTGPKAKQDTDGGKALKASGKSISAPASVARRGVEVAACLPTIFGDPAPHMWTWLEGWMNLHHGIGVGHFWIYTMGALPPAPMQTAAPHTFLDVSWVPGVKKRSRGPGMW
jgi:hypothetical protein